MSASTPKPAAQETYTLKGSLLQQTMAGRTAAKQAAFLLPYLQPGMKLVDCGCGPGSITMGLAEVVAPGEVVGIDIEAAQVEKAGQLAAAQGISNVRFEPASVYELPFADESVDAVFSNAVIQHLREPMTALREMFRILKPGGLIGVRTVDVDGGLEYPPDEISDKVRAWVDALQREQGQNSRIGKQLRSLVHRAGFERTIATASYDQYPTQDDLRRIANAFAAAAVKGWYAEQIVAHGWATQAELEEIAAHTRAWGEDPEAFFAEAACEVVAWRLENPT